MRTHGLLTLPLDLRSIAELQYWQWPLTVVLYTLLHQLFLASAQTNSTDAAALSALKASLFPTTDTALQAYNWTITTDICGMATCGPLTCSIQTIGILTGSAGEVQNCNWGGICCTDWEVTGISLVGPSSVASALTPGLPEAFGWMRNLEVLQMPKKGYNFLCILCCLPVWCTHSLQ